MVTAQELHSVTFDKGLRGYNMDQVDDFLDRVAEQLEADEKNICELSKNNEELKDKLLELAKKLEEYHNDEDALKSALLNAQRMGENVIREARQKADALEREASIRSENVLRAGAEKIQEQELELQRIKAEVAQFKASVLGLYKMHIESLSQLPDSDKADVAQPVEEPVEEPAAEEPVAIAPEVETPEAEPAVQPVQQEENSAEKDTFWQKDEEELTAEIAAPIAGKSENFRGITFSD